MVDVNDWIWLYVPCPVEDCKEDKIPTYWTHHNCPYSFIDHDIKINSAGYLKCNACVKFAELIRWRFDCSSGKHGFKEVDNIIRLTEILQVMVRASDDPQFVVRLMASVSQMFLDRLL